MMNFFENMKLPLLNIPPRDLRIPFKRKSKQETTRESFKKIRQCNKYKIYVLREPKIVELNDPVALQRCKLSYRIKELTENAVDTLQNALSEIDSNMLVDKTSLDHKTIVMPGIKTKLFDVIGRDMEKFPESTLCRLKIEIKGIQEKDGIRTPYWNIKEAHFNYQ